MENQITDRAFWEKYWRSKEGLDVEVKRSYTFHKLLNHIIIKNDIRSAIELGGFPGYYAIFLKKYFKIATSLFDFFIDTRVLDMVLKRNGLSRGEIGVIEGDLFLNTPKDKFDLVLSCGLIEHFLDTRDIISRHLNFLNTNGTLFITLPNFIGINGWVQRKYDKANLDKHNLKSMDLSLLSTVCRELGLCDIQVFYYGKFNVWLERSPRKPLLVRLMVKCIWFIGKSISVILPFESKYFSPYIVVIAKRA